MTRRGFLALLGGALATGRGGALAAPTEEREPGDGDRILDLEVGGASDLARRARIVLPRGLAPGERAPALVLLHGLAETASESLGIGAWTERYGLRSSEARLLKPPVSPPGTSRRYLPAARAEAIDREVVARPFRPLLIACPYTPSPRRVASGDALDRYAAWIADALLPAVRAQAPAAGVAGIDGCSLGGWLALEVFVRRPEAFAAVGGVQAALGAASVVRLAEGIERARERAGPRPLQLLTSSQDPYREANRELSRDLERRGIRHELAELPGPHTQPWLQEAGTLEMLLWQERQLRAVPEKESR